MKQRRINQKSSRSKSMKLKVPPGFDDEPSVPDEKTRPAKVATVTADTPVSMGGPQWENALSISGVGAFKIPEPYIMRFPNKAGVRRDVNVTVSSWRGHSVGATHYYARVELERNAIWNVERLGWHTDNAHPACKDVFYRAHVPTKGVAITFIELIIKTFYNDEKLFRICHADGYIPKVETWEGVKALLLNDD